jgi:plastocyanin
MTATASGLVGSPVTFHATAQALSANATIKVGNGAQLVFVPSQVTIPVGGTVTWQWNSGGVAHNVTTSSGSPAIPGTPTATVATPNSFGPVTFATAGTYRFYCSVHATPTATTGMVGTIVVQ